MEAAPADLRPLTAWRAAALFVLTVVLVALAGWWNPLRHFAAMLVVEEKTATQPAHRDSRHHAVNYETQLPPRVAGHKLVVFIGTSQQYTCSLPQGVLPRPGHECVVTSDLFSAELAKRAPGVFDTYNVGAPNQTFVEALWRAIYWYKVEERAPDVLVIQAAFDGFRKGGVRAEFQELLAQPRFAEAVEQYQSATQGSYRGQFVSARKEYEQRMTEVSSEGSVEQRLRNALSWIPLYREREQLRRDFLNSLYNLRVKLLRIKPTTRRHITGAPVAANLDALRDLLQLAHKAGTRVFIYIGPVNPRLSMFYEDEYNSIVSQISELARENSASYLDLAGAVPPDQWGFWISGPDPIHVTEEGHQTIARRLFEAWGAKFLSN